MATRIEYRESAAGVSASDLKGFFEGWPRPPAPATHLRLLHESYAIVLAIDASTSVVAGFITAISDGILSAHIPLLEVRPAYRGQGIGSELVRRLLRRLNHLYMVDLVCDWEVQPFYERCGMAPSFAAIIRNYDRQSGLSQDPIDENFSSSI